SGVALEVVGGARTQAVRQVVVGGQREGARGRLLQPEERVAVVVVQDPARHTEHPEVRRNEVDLPRKAVSGAVGQVVMPPLRMLADGDQGLLVQAGSVAAADLVLNPE